MGGRPKIEECENGLVIDFTSSQYYKVLSWLLSRGASARPIEPPQLVEEWKKNIVKLYEKVQKLFPPSLSD
ncbi:MAG: hypothetical protein LBT01_05640 [Spirochaetaceae bacterium]|jgi:hypothetical protein|nr:hypothetical protein [Spirochaetaceae bacterium]